VALEGRRRFRGHDDEAARAWLYGIARHHVACAGRRNPAPDPRALRRCVSGSLGWAHCVSFHARGLGVLGPPAQICAWWGGHKIRRYANLLVDARRS
jgi:hypothetical protein